MYNRWHSNAFSKVGYNQRLRKESPVLALNICYVSSNRVLTNTGGKTREAGVWMIETFYCCEEVSENGK